MIPSVLRWARAWRLPVLAAAVAATVLGLIALRGLTFDADVLHLLPKQGRAVPAFEQFLQQFGSIEHLYVVFEAPAGHAVDDYQDQIEAFVARLKALPEIERVDAGLFGEGRDWRYLADRVLLVLSPERAKEALDRFGAGRLPGQVAGARELLGVPSPEMAAMVRQDPLGLFMLMRDQLQGAAASTTVDASRGGYITKDGRSQLVLARPRRPPFDIDFSKQLFDQLTRIERESFAGSQAGSQNAGGQKPQDPQDDDETLPPLKVTFAGGHRISIETEREVRAETVWNTVGSLAVILPLLFIAFRSPWLVAVGPLPSALAILMVLAMYAVAHVTLSAAATGAAAMLFGLGIDGVVLMFVDFRQGISEGKSADESVAAMGAKGGTASSMLLGMWTTAATFYGLTIIDFPSLQELGALIGHGMVLCGILTLILVPALLPRRVTKRVPPLTSWWLARFVTSRSSAIIIGAIVLTVALGAAATRIRVDASLDKLRSTSGAAALEQQIAERFGLPRDVYFVIARGTDLESLLKDNEKFVDALERERPSLSLYAPSSLLPSQARQAEAASRVRAAGLTVTDVTARLRAAADEAGFREDTFAPFIDRLPALLDPNANARLTFDGFYAQGLGDVLGRTIVRTTRGVSPFDADATDGYLVATYVYPSSDDDVRALRHQVEAFGDRMTLTGLPEVNRELAARFTPEFLQGLALGTALVLALIVMSFRRLDLTLLALVPTMLALIWAGGFLALARVELDLFSVFAVMTFVGIGVDYGIHMVHRFQHADDTSEVIAQLGPVIMVAGGITLLGFGTLVTSSYPPLRSLGLISTVMIVTLMMSSLLVLPALLVPETSRMTGGGISVCVIVPAFNEAGTVADVVRGARACAHVDDVVVVDDGSADETVARAAQAGAHVLRHEQNRGKGHAVRTGLAFALERPFTHVLLMDGDMQHRPADVPQMIEAARTHDVDLVVGERVFDKSQMPTSRYYSNVIGSRALSSFIGSEVRDSQSGFRLIRSEILRGMPLSSTGYEIETEMLIKLARRRARMTSVPVQLSYGAKSKLRPVRDTTRTCFLAVYYRFLSRD